ncbi:MAG: galactose ABC transporter substrate-binding protein [Bacilli bacterium]
MTKNKLLIICSSLSVLLSGCKQVQKKIGIFLYNSNDTFITELNSYLTEKLKISYDYKVFDAQESQVSQNEQLLSVLREDYSCLLINTVDRLASSAIIEKCSAKNLPLIFFNREPLSEDIQGKEDIYYVGTSASIAGEYQAEMAFDLFVKNKALDPVYDRNKDGRIQTVVIKGEKGHQDAEQRTKSSTNRLRDLLISALGDNGEDRLEILSVESADWMRSKGQNVMKNMYTEYGDKIELVLSNNDDMAVGAIDYLLGNEKYMEQISSKTRVFLPIFGVDATDVGRGAIANGYLAGTVLNDADGQASAISALVDYELGNKDLSDFPYEFTDGNRIYIDERKLTKDTL